MGGNLAAGSSPHTRGALDRYLASISNWRIIPAYAGSTSASPAAASGRGDHPRIRGEHSKSDWHVTYIEGSSPHTRGALLEAVLLENDEGIIPAYAGSTWR